MHNIKLFLLFLLLSTRLSANELPEVSISDVWINEAPPFVQTLAAYATINNHSNETKVLNAITSSFFSRVEIHQSIVINGMAKMQEQTSINIDANSEFRFSPGGYHMMLFTPSSPLKAGDKVPLVFSFTDGSSLTVEAHVIKRDNKKHTHEHHHM